LSAAFVETLLFVNLFLHCPELFEFLLHLINSGIGNNARLLVRRSCVFFFPPVLFACGGRGGLNLLNPFF
jgi:hypothetical protein